MRKMFKKYKKIEKSKVMTLNEVIDRFKIPYERVEVEHEKINNSSELSFFIKRKLSIFHFPEQAIDHMIDKFTQEEFSDEDFVDMSRNIKRLTHHFIINIKRFLGNKGFEIETKKGSIKVIKAYEYFPKLLDYMPNQNNKRRDRQCHWSAMMLSTLMSLSGIENEVVSGYVYEFSKKEEYSHSWVEFLSENGNPFVFDGNRGAIISKDGYYMIKHPRDISKISHKDIVCEQTIFPIFEKIEGGEWINKLYFHDREMALRVYKDIFGKKFVPKDYEACKQDMSIILELDQENQVEPIDKSIQRES